MAAKNKPYEQFGPYILLKKLESESLSELWRAARIDRSSLGPPVALRRFIGGNRDAMASAAETASRIAPLLTGTSFVKQQTAGVIDNLPFIAYEYASGRSLRYLMEKARGGNGSQANPLPLDQAIVIAERVALSLATTADLRFDGNRLMHGCPLPQFIWITDDGEIRVAGQQLAGGLLASLRDSRVAAEIARYFAPESVTSGIQSKTADVYGMGALLFLLVSGIEPPDATNVSAFGQVVRAARTTTGAAIPVEIRAILDKSLTLDANARFTTMAEMKQAITALANNGKYSGTTFNLAFYISTLLKKELEAEVLERDRESKVNVEPYVEALAAPPAVAPGGPASTETPMFAAAMGASKPRSRAPLAIAALVVVAGIGAGAFFMFRSQATPARATPVTVQTAAAIVPPPRPAIVSQPLVAAAPSTTTSAPTDTAASEAARKQAFEAAVQQKLQAEMMKLQADYTNKLQQAQSKQAPVQVATATVAPAPPPARAAAEEPSASQLDQQRLAARTQTVPAPVTQTQAVPPPTVTAAPVQPPPAPAVREGDIIDVSDVDTPPHVTRPSAPIYPPMALRQHVSTTVILTALVTENGEVTDVRILRGDERFGFNEAAMRAVRTTRFAPATKDGKRVKVWFPIPVQFKQ